MYILFIISHTKLIKEAIMAKIIRIDENVYNSLKLLGETFEDTPNSVIERVLKQINKYKPIHRTIIKTSGVKTPQEIFEKYLLFTLWKHFSGKGEKKKVTEKTIEIMNNNKVLSDADYIIVKTGETRAVNTTAWARNSLKNGGKISSNSIRGIWELTEKGIIEAKTIVI